jgi:hypothetical protein
VKGKVEGHLGDLKILDEKGRLVLNIPVDQNGSFNCELLPTILYPLESKWKLFQVRISEPENRADLSELNINICIYFKNSQKKVE